MKYLKTVKTSEVAEVLQDLMGTYAIKGSPDEIKIADNLVNRVVLGLPLDVAAGIPTELSFTEGLYDYQIEDVYAMVNSKAFLNRNKPGYGKTIEAVAALRNLNAQTVLIVAPNATLYQWSEQFKAWWPDRTNDVEIVTPKTQFHVGKVYIVNPEKVTSATYTLKISNLLYDVLIVDEAHMLKNRTSQRSKTIKNICARYKWGLTGTPILRNPDDLWSILDFLSPLYAGSSYWNFVRHFCRIQQTFFGEKIDGLTSDPRKVSILNTVLTSISCYHPERKTDCGKIKIEIPVVMEKEQKNLYKKVRQLVLDELPEDMTIANGAVHVIRLLQVSTAPSMFVENLPGAKFDWIKQFLEYNPTEKIVVYSKFEKAISALSAFLTENKVTHRQYTGKIENKVRLRNLWTFKNNKNCRVLLGTIDSLGVGVDGLQDSSHICVFLDKDYLPEINGQCEDRLNRLGQSEEVLSYYLNCVGTWDNKVTQVNNMRIADVKRLLESEEIE